jgi:hypothetical protein
MAQVPKFQRVKKDPPPRCGRAISLAVITVSKYIAA